MVPFPLPKPPAARPHAPWRWMKTLGLAALAALALAPPAQAFCGFYVGKADSRLFNQASQVILARDGNRTVISMANDYDGPLDEFALVVPVPVVLGRDQVHVGEAATFARIDAWSAPRLAEYHDPSPCDQARREMLSAPRLARAAAPAAEAQDARAALGVTVQERYTVGEYDIVILSATQSDGLQTWLSSNGYRLPPNAAQALAPYIRQGMKFFVAKVNLPAQARSGQTRLRPLQFAYESRRFMLPLRLGMLNANGPQDLIVYALTRHGRVEASNYRTVKLPANLALPVGVRAEFGRFYQALFERQAAREGHRVVFTEHFWNMAWCDPCAADPLSPQELRAAGVFWLDGPGQDERASPQRRLRAPSPVTGAAPVMLTRLHVRYTAETFPEDLMLTETSDQENFQTRYVLRNAYEGPMNCPEAAAYRQELQERRESEARQLTELTGWPLAQSRRQAGLAEDGGSAGHRSACWRKLWP
jgi:hypothetical protein